MNNITPIDNHPEGRTGTKVKKWIQEIINFIETGKKENKFIHHISLSQILKSGEGESIWYNLSGSDFQMASMVRLFSSDIVRTKIISDAIEPWHITIPVLIIITQ